MHVFLNKMCSRSLSKIVMSDVGDKVVSNAGSVGLHKPENVFDPDAFATEILRPDRTELVNRPDVGLSMIIGNIVATKKNIDEGGCLWNQITERQT